MSPVDLRSLFSDSSSDILFLKVTGSFKFMSPCKKLGYALLFLSRPPTAPAEPKPVGYIKFYLGAPRFPVPILGGDDPPIDEPPRLPPVDYIPKDCSIAFLRAEESPSTLARAELEFTTGFPKR